MSQTLQLSSAPIQQATIFSEHNRIGEIQRNFKVSLTSGFNEIKIENLPLHLVNDSIRVSGTGSVTLHDVSTKNQEGVEVQLPPRVALLKNDLETKTETMSTLEDQKSIIEKQINSLDQLLVKSCEGKESFVFNSNTIDHLNSLNEYYKQRIAELKKENRIIAKKLEKAKGEYNRALNAFNSTGYANLDSITYAEIILEAAEDVEAELQFKYQVYNVHWRPFYDLRVTTGKEPELNIIYSARISQSSGEDWENVPLILSTASPRAGGQLPKLGTLDVSIAKPQEENFAIACNAAPMMMMKNSRRQLGGSPDINRSVATVRKSTISSEFIISRPATIQDRTEAFKVTIGVIDLKPKLSYSTVPSKNAVAYLIASAVNTSQYSLISGEASVFIDGTFINKIYIDDVVVNQKLTASLSIDPSIKITYKPEKKYQEQTGLITKSNTIATEKTIIVNNHRDESILLTIHENVPRSTDERIVVRLRTPTASESALTNNEELKEGAILTKDHNLEYTVKLSAGEEKTVIVKYNIEHPKTEEITFSEKF